MCVCLRQKVMISAPDKAVFSCLLEKYDFAGKTVIPFATSGGSSITGSVKQLKKLYPKIEWKEGRLFNGGTANVAGWSKQIIEKL